MTRSRCVVVALVTVLVSGCSTDRLATRHAVRLAVSALPAYDRETDLEFAAQGMAGQLQFLEGLLESAPDDPALLLAAARSFARSARLASRGIRSRMMAPRARSVCV